MDEFGRKGPEVAPGFYWEDDSGKRTEVPCMKCGKRANVRVNKENEDLYWCARCWEFLPTDYQ
jgi:hypothetical protein